MPAVQTCARTHDGEFFVHSMGSPELQVFLEGHAADFAFQANAQAVAEFSRVVKDSTGFLAWTCQPLLANAWMAPARRSMPSHLASRRNGHQCQTDMETSEVRGVPELQSAGCSSTAACTFRQKACAEDTRPVPRRGCASKCSALRCSSFPRHITRSGLMAKLPHVFGARAQGVGTFDVVLRGVQQSAHASL